MSFCGQTHQAHAASLSGALKPKMEIFLHLACIVPVHFWRECTFSPKCTFSLFTSDGFPVACHSTGKRESKEEGAFTCYMYMYV